MKKILPAMVSLALSACGFTPLMEKASADNPSSGGARLSVTNENGDGGYSTYRFRQLLRGKLSGLNLDDRHKIFVKLSEASGSLAYAIDATASRAMDRLSARLSVGKDGVTVFETTLNAATSYSQNVNDEFVNESARIGAKERLLEALSDDVAEALREFAKVSRNARTPAPMP